jgi:hypothetical protein
MGLSCLTKSTCKTIAWAMALVFACAPLGAQAAMAFNAINHHCADHADHAGAVDGETAAHDHASDTSHAHPDALDPPAKHKGHDHSGSHVGSCCGTFCHSAVAITPAVMLVPPTGFRPETVMRTESAAGIDPHGLLRPPKQ